MSPLQRDRMIRALPALMLVFAAGFLVHCGDGPWTCCASVSSQCSCDTTDPADACADTGVGDLKEVATCSAATITGATKICCAGTSPASHCSCVGVDQGTLECKAGEFAVDDCSEPPSSSATTGG